MNELRKLDQVVSFLMEHLQSVLCDGPELLEAENGADADKCAAVRKQLGVVGPTVT
jgi:hypothetical protein